ncbi:hypothetical protein G4G27_01000 [Sphingomonas sp. So64.6b]|nr:hypothetical protein G4G27_01000 [Sphingomonas sp. So64.6b]
MIAAAIASGSGYRRAGRAVLAAACMFHMTPATAQAVAGETPTMDLHVPPPTPPANSWAGEYRISQHELVAGIALNTDGTFRYGLTVGSLDETASGRWSATGNHIQLVSEPRPVPPAITVGPALRDPKVGLSLKVIAPKGRGVAGVDLVVGFDDGGTVQDYTQVYGWTVPDEEKRAPRWVQFSLESYGLRSPRFPVDRNVANTLTFILTPNDFGVVDFTGVPVEVDSDSLVIHREGGDMRFRRVRD